VPTLPPKVHEKAGRYYYVHRNKWHPLSRIDEGPEALYLKLQEHTQGRPATYGQLFILYLARGMTELKPASRPDYTRIIAGRLQHHFGKMALGTLTPGHVAQFLELRKQEGAPVGGNRERAVLGSVCSWAMRFGWLESNPCLGVRRNREKPSKVYVTDQTFRDGFDRASPALQDLLAVGYLSGLRQTDLRLMRKSQVTEEGLELDQSKDGKRRVVEWTPALRYFVDRAGARSGCDHLFVGMSGKPWGVWGLQSAMKRLGPGFKFRELRPKAASDSSHNVLGHAGQMLTRYVRAERVRPVR